MKHWIYVLAGQDLRKQAEGWKVVKTMQGKEYEVILARVDETPKEKLKKVENDDILYVYTHMWANFKKIGSGIPDGKLGGSEKEPAKLAQHLKDELLDLGHRRLKLFACYSGDASDKLGGLSYAEALYKAMITDEIGFKDIVVYGYHGEVTPTGFDRHKTAGLTHGECLQIMQKSVWNERNLRAKKQRVVFPQSMDNTGD